MVRKVVVKKDTYRDSITLMKLSNTVSALPGVSQAAVVMATQLNKRLLADVGFSGAEIERAASDNLIVALEANNGASLGAAVTEIERLLSPEESGTQIKPMPRSLGEAIETMPDANLVLISVPGRFAKREALQALDRNLNVFMFSSNVSREDELELKRLARRKQLLMMGPDCGTSIINHAVLGFGNVVREGPIGLVSASGTGLQEVSTLIHAAGLGVSQAIGVGGGDLSEGVGGIMTTEALEILERDKRTKVIVLISKPPGAKTTKKVLKACESCKKPVVVNFLGWHGDTDDLGGLKCAQTLEQAARIACRLAGQETEESMFPKETVVTARAQFSRLAKRQRYIRGLYAGGTLCYEAQTVLQPLLVAVYSNAPIEPEYKVGSDASSRENCFIDMGAEEFVVGRAHPMIDFTLRKKRVLRETRDPGTAVILLDIELGYGSHPDPAGELSPVIAEAKAIAETNGRFLSVVASLIGTEGDPQGLTEQEKMLRDVGVLIAASNAKASRLAAFIASRGEAETMILEGSD